jgi:hypothetical protein
MARPSVRALQSMIISAALVALGIVVPIGFHAVGLGARFTPMILVLMLSGFLLPPRWAVLTGAIVPVLSALLTGMPPLYPPFFLAMSIELSLVCGAVALLFARTAPRVLPALLCGIVLDRGISVLLTFYLAGWFGLPPRLFTLASLAQSLPGVALQLAVIPVVLRVIHNREGLLFADGKRSETPVLQ